MYSSMKVSINVKALNTALTLYTVSNVAEQLVHVQIVSPSFGNPDIEFDEVAMQHLSEYLDANNGVEAFQQVFAVGSIQDIGGVPLVPQITGFSPDTVRGGTGDILTITGIDFGTTKGQVKFPNADDGGETYTQTPTGDILTWTPTRITLRIPSQFGGANPAGTGKFRVETSTGQIDSSSTELEILFAMNNFQTTSSTSEFLFLADSEFGDGTEDGTLKFHIDTTINNNQNTKLIVERALRDWNNVTGIKWLIDTFSTKNTCADFDSVNLIYFAGANEFVGTSATAYTKISGSRIESCQSPGNPINPVSYLREVDIVLREDLTTIPNNQATGGYSFDINNLMPNQLDFYSVVSHELGHAHLLRHAIDTNKIMYWQLLPGTSRQDISYADFKGGEFVLLKSDTVLGLGFCPETVDREVICVTNTTNAIDIDVELNVFPNPFTNNISVDLTLSKSVDNLSFSVYNLLGQHISHQNIGRVSEGNQLFSISNLEFSPNGMYFLVLKFDNTSIVHKIIKN
jgi:hypothetical protein